MSPANPENPTILSVSELNQYARGLLDMHLGTVWVTGEISNLSRPASGHWYFTLKDANAQIRCAMFRNRNQLIRTPVDNGMQILLQGKASIYEARGDFQLVVDYLEEYGIGALQRQFERLKQELAAEGLFEQRHKQPLPKTIRHLGVVTSRTGAALQDILKVLRHRFPAMRVTLIPCSVQGDKAAGEICHAIRLAERWNTENIEAIDALIVGRGGGSLEDLWPFNEASVARAIFDCKIPIISAVGHEIDTTISDLVADVRAPTPSAAAEMASPSAEQLSQYLDSVEERLATRIEQQLKVLHHRLGGLEARLQHPGQQLAHLRLRLEGASRELVLLVKKQLEYTRQDINLFAAQVASHKPQERLNTSRQRTSQLEQSLVRAMQQVIHGKRQSLEANMRLLDIVSPLATLQRGYSITQDIQGNIVRQHDQVTVGDTLVTRLADGKVSSVVQDSGKDN